MLKKLDIRNFLSIGRFITVFFYTALLLGIWMKSWGRFPLENFNRRIISIATLSGIDVNMRVSFYYKSVALGILIFLIVLYSYVWFFRILQKISRKNSSNSYNFEMKIIDLLSFFGLTTAFFGFFGTGWKITLSFVFFFQFLIIILSIWKSLAFHQSWSNVSLLLSNRNLVIWQFLNSFMVMFYLAYFARTFRFNLGNHILTCYLIGFFINIILLYVFFILLQKNQNTPALAARLIVMSAIPIFITPMYFTLANELYLIFNQNSIYIITPKKLLFFLLLMSVFAAFLTFYYANKYNGKKVLRSSVGRLLHRIYYPLCLIIMAMIVYQPSIKGGPPGELFESGNVGVSIDQFFKYGKIPFLETFNAHALSELLSPAIFSFFNGYHGWTSYLYSDLINKSIYLLLVYFLLRKLITAELAFLTLLLFPLNVFSSAIAPEYFSFAILSVLVLHRVLNNTSYINYLLFWFVLICIFLWRFDVGTAAILAVLVVYFLYLILYKGKWSFKNFVFAGATVAGFWFISFVLLAAIKGVPIAFRLKEIYSIVSSNQIWGYPAIGDSQKPKYYLYYFLVPLINIGIGIFIIYKTHFIKKVKPEVFMVLLFLLCFTFFNFPRGLVRHSLVENFTSIIVGLFALPLLYLPFLFWQKRSLFENYIKFMVIGVIYAILFLFTGTGLNGLDTSLMGQSVIRFSSFNDYPVINAKIERYEEPQGFAANNYSSLKKLFDETMGAKETFIDFSNAPFMYVFTGREAPMYINQTPAFLSDEISQISYLKEIESHLIPYVLFADIKGWTTLDGIPNNIRSYRIAEYIYKNYVPFIKVDGFIVWVKKDRQADLAKKISIAEPTNEVEISLYNAADQKQVMYGIADINNYEISETGLKLNTGVKDPQLFGLLTTIKQKEIPLENAKDHSLQLDFTSRVGGTIQVFYLLNDQPYIEQNSISIDIKASNNKQTVNIPIPFIGSLRDIRLDPPKNDSLQIHSLKLLKQSSNNLSYEPYSSPETNQDMLGQLPYIWGQYDPLHVKDKTKVLADLIAYGIVDKGHHRFPVEISIDKKLGNYVHFRLRSKEVRETYQASVEYGEVNNTGQFIFNVVADGQFHDYFIRVSSQYNWYKSNIKYLDLTFGAETEIEQFNIRQGD